MDWSNRFKILSSLTLRAKLSPARRAYRDAQLDCRGAKIDVC